MRSLPPPVSISLERLSSDNLKGFFWWQGNIDNGGGEVKEKNCSCDFHCQRSHLEVP